MNQYNNQQDQFVHPSVVKQFAHLPDGRPNPLLAQFATGLVKNLGSIKFDPRAGLTEEDRYLIQERQKLAQQAVEINRQLTEQQIQAEKDAAMAQFKQMAGAGRQKTQQPPPQPQQWQQPVPQQQPVQQPIPQPEYYQNQEWVPNEYVNNSSNIISLDEDAKFFCRNMKLNLVCHLFLFRLKGRAHPGLPAPLLFQILCHQTHHNLAIES